MSISDIVSILIDLTRIYQIENNTMHPFTQCPNNDLILLTVRWKYPYEDKSLALLNGIGSPLETVLRIEISTTFILVSFYYVVWMFTITNTMLFDECTLLQEYIGLLFSFFMTYNDKKEIDSNSIEMTIQLVELC